MNIEEILNKIYTSELLSSEELHELTEWVCNKDKEIERLNKCIDRAFEIIIKDWYDKNTIPIHAVVDTGEDIRIKLYYELFFKGVDK